MYWNGTKSSETDIDKGRYKQKVKKRNKEQRNGRFDMSISINCNKTETRINESETKSNNTETKNNKLDTKK